MQNTAYFWFAKIQAPAEEMLSQGGVLGDVHQQDAKILGARLPQDIRVGVPQVYLKDPDQRRLDSRLLHKALRIRGDTFGLGCRKFSAGSKIVMNRK